MENQQEVDVVSRLTENTIMESVLKSMLPDVREKYTEWAEHEAKEKTKSKKGLVEQVYDLFRKILKKDEGSRLGHIYEIPTLPTLPTLEGMGVRTGLKGMYIKVYNTVHYLNRDESHVLLSMPLYYRATMSKEDIYYLYKYTMLEWKLVEEIYKETVSKLEEVEHLLGSEELKNYYKIFLGVEIQAIDIQERKEYTKRMSNDKLYSTLQTVYDMLSVVDIESIHHVLTVSTDMLLSYQNTVNLVLGPITSNQMQQEITKQITELNRLKGVMLGIGEGSIYGEEIRQVDELVQSYQTLNRVVLRDMELQDVNMQGLNTTGRIEQVETTGIKEGSTGIDLFEGYDLDDTE